MSQFTQRYLLAEVAAFRGLMGERSFWESPDRRRVAIKALGYVYLNAESTSSGQSAFFGALEEYVRRDALVQTSAPPLGSRGAPTQAGGDAMP